MKEKLSLTGDLKIRQEPWLESPCHLCSRSPCCRNLPLTPFQMKSRSDFINLTLLSCYSDIYPALKKSGEWTIYLGRDCRYLNSQGKCSIHAADHQSMICKSYSAHDCWYIEAFSQDRSSTMIPFTTSMMIWLEQEYELTARRFDVAMDWEKLCDETFAIRQTAQKTESRLFETCDTWRLPFRKSRSDRYLFFPPYGRPGNRRHFELLSFRLGFPGVYLAVSDTTWAFMVKTEIVEPRLGSFRRQLFPAIEHSDGDFSFNGLAKLHQPYTDSGDQWLILSRRDLDMLKDLTVFDSEGTVLSLPSCAAIARALRPREPQRAG